jgi:hypothetical protein
MDNISNSLGFGASSSSDPKAAVMNQVRQEAAMTNARQLIEVQHSVHRYVYFLLIVSRKSMSTASRNASQNRAPHYRVARQHVSRNAWRNIWRRGIQSADNILIGYSKRVGGVLLAEGFSRAKLRKTGGTKNDKAVRLGHVLYVIKIGGQSCTEGREGIDGVIMNHLFAILSMPTELEVVSVEFTTGH